MIKTENKECCQCQHCKKTKERPPEEFRSLMNRIKRIQGQLRGIEGMLENNAYCTDIMIQVAAAGAALNSFNRELLSAHIKTCVAQNIREGNDEVIDELLVTLQKLMK
ncbi:MAG: metal-sensing transcriptional repressor [Oscillospiraceae bacterium]|nr:metal-sensing transcriptional repressor [Oscillospiraceae bacterium]